MHLKKEKDGERSYNIRNRFGKESFPISWNRKLKASISDFLTDAENDLTIVIRNVKSRLFSELLNLEDEIKFYEQKIKEFSKKDLRIKKLEQTPRIGFLTVSALLAAMGDPKLFKNSRHFSAWLGLVPKQNSTGNNSRLMGIRFFQGQKVTFHTTGRIYVSRSVFIQISIFFTCTRRGAIYVALTRLDDEIWSVIPSKNILNNFNISSAFATQLAEAEPTKSQLSGYISCSPCIPAFNTKLENNINNVT
jgi:hypothetical protein